MLYLKKQSHYPLILIENSNLLFPQISEGPRLQKERHPYGPSSNQLTHIQEGEVKRSSYRTHVIAVAALMIRSSSLHWNSDPTSKFKFWNPTCSVLLRTFFGTRGEGKSRDKACGTQCLLISAWRATAVQVRFGLRLGLCQVGPAPDLGEQRSPPF